LLSNGEGDWIEQEVDQKNNFVDFNFLLIWYYNKEYMSTTKTFIFANG
jgi:hypothetical protein